MPRSAPTPCLEPNCATLCYGTPRCPEHTIKRIKVAHTEHDVKTNGVVADDAARTTAEEIEGMEEYDEDD